MRWTAEPRSAIAHTEPSPAVTDQIGSGTSIIGATLPVARSMRCTARCSRQAIHADE